MNYELKNDTVATIPITTIDSTGDIVPAIVGDTFTVVSSDLTKLTAVIGLTAAGAPAVVLTPLVKLGPGLTITVSDTSHLTDDVQTVDIVADLTPSAVGLDLADVTTVAQPVPLAA